MKLDEDRLPLGVVKTRDRLKMKIINKGKLAKVAIAAANLTRDES